MDGWAQFWTWLFIIGLTLFCGLAVVVSIRGLADIRALFKGVREQHERESE